MLAHACGNQQLKKTVENVEKCQMYLRPIKIYNSCTILTIMSYIRPSMK